jgi:hypothetical protein
MSIGGLKQLEARVSALEWKEYSCVSVMRGRSKERFPSLALMLVILAPLADIISTYDLLVIPTASGPNILSYLEVDPIGRFLLMNFGLLGFFLLGLVYILPIVGFGYFLYRLFGTRAAWIWTVGINIFISFAVLNNLGILAAPFPYFNNYFPPWWPH